MPRTSKGIYFMSDVLGTPFAPSTTHETIPEVYDQQSMEKVNDSTENAVSPDATTLGSKSGNIWIGLVILAVLAFFLGMF